MTNVTSIPSKMNLRHALSFHRKTIKYDRSKKCMMDFYWAGL